MPTPFASALLLLPARLRPPTPPPHHNHPAASTPLPSQLLQSNLRGLAGLREAPSLGAFATGATKAPPLPASAAPTAAGSSSAAAGSSSPAEARNAEGLRLAAANKPRRALKAFQDAVLLDPKHPSIW